MAAKNHIRYGKEKGTRNDRSLAKDVMGILGIGLMAGTALIAATNAVMKKIEEEKAKLAENPEDMMFDFDLEEGEDIDDILRNVSKELKEEEENDEEPDDLAVEDDMEDLA